MPNKHFYFSMGAWSGFILTHIHHKIYVDSRKWGLNNSGNRRNLSVRRIQLRLLFLFLMGVFALVPDIFHMFGILKKSVTRGPFFDLFFFHSTFERIEDAAPHLDWLLNLIGSISLLALAILMQVDLALRLYRSIHYKKQKRPWKGVR